MKFKLPDWEIVLFIFANLICTTSYVLPVLLVGILFSFMDLAAMPGDSGSIRVCNCVCGTYCPDVGGNDRW